MPCSIIFCRSFAILSGSTAGFVRGFGGGTTGMPRNSFGVPGGGPPSGNTVTGFGVATFGDSGSGDVTVGGKLL